MCRLAGFCLVVFGLAAAQSSRAGMCPDYDSVENLPAFEFPEQREFQHSGNEFISGWTAYHMVHDVMLARGDVATVVGKFDYGEMFHKDLEDEWIHTYVTGTGVHDWQYLGAQRTNYDGKVYVQVGPLSEGDYRVRMVVEGDLTWADGFLSVTEPGRQAILFDIDGTVTRDASNIDIVNAQPHPNVVDVIETYMEKGYAIVFLTARPYWMARDTRNWLVRFGLPNWHLKTNPQGELFDGLDPVPYKRDYLIHLMDNAGIDILRTYGDTTTDIEAYEEAGIPKADTYIIGDHAGEMDTQPILDYHTHLEQVAQPTQVVDCD